MDISCRVVFSSNKWHKKEGSPSSFRRKRQLISLNSSVFIENLPSFERARANHVKIDAQKGCAMQLNGITLRTLKGITIKKSNRATLTGDQIQPTSHGEGVHHFLQRKPHIKQNKTFERIILYLYKRFIKISNFLA